MTENTQPHTENDERATALIGRLRRAIPDRLKVSVRSDVVTIQMTSKQADILARRLEG